jgi:hypothetical protein
LAAGFRALFDELSGSDDVSPLNRAALSDSFDGVDPRSLIVRDTSSVAVGDASLFPTIVPAHPVGTTMARRRPSRRYLGGSVVSDGGHNRHLPC